MPEGEGIFLRVNQYYCTPLFLDRKANWCSGFFAVSLFSFIGRHCLFPHGTRSRTLCLTIDEFVYFLPAATYSIILLVTLLLYCLRFLLGLRRWPRQAAATSTSPRLRIPLKNFARIAVIAGLIVLSHLLYRYASEFALGIELTVVKV